MFLWLRGNPRLLRAARPASSRWKRLCFFVVSSFGVIASSLCYITLCLTIPFGISASVLLQAPLPVFTTVHSIPSITCSNANPNDVPLDLGHGWPKKRNRRGCHQQSHQPSVLSYPPRQAQSLLTSTRPRNSMRVVAGDLRLILHAPF